MLTWGRESDGRNFPGFRQRVLTLNDSGVLAIYESVISGGSSTGLEVGLQIAGDIVILILGQ